MAAKSDKKSSAPAKSTSSKVKIKDQPFAVVATGGKQFLVQAGNTIRIAKLDAEAGSSVSISDILLVGVEGDTQLKVGAPSVDGASVQLKVLRHARAKKVIIFKKKRRKGYTKKQGHRQDFTEVFVEAINY